MRAILLSAIVAACLGCNVVELDDEASGLYPCEVDEDCPPGLFCVTQTCFLGAPPEVRIIAPEPETAFPVGSEETQMVVVTVGGDNLVLAEPGEDPDSDYGRGNVVVYVDGVEVAELTASELSTGVTLEVPVNSIAGAHRVYAEARFSNGVLYDNDGAQGRQFFWLDDGIPHVGFVHPFPGDVFPLEATSVEFEVAALNFDFLQAMPSAIPDEEPVGHAHVHFNDQFPGCVEDPVCDNSYVGVVAPEGPASSAVSTLVLPASAAGEATLTAVLRSVNHFKYLYPDQATGVPIWEDIIIRRADIGPLEDTEDTD